ncbi:MAG: polysaccharide biosynthesis protein [Lachnospiraceae bacterium]|nr:polysaccharide biosynthesis protein [Lachnospiraceae bacterium]
MSETQKKKATNFLVQGSILAMAGLLCRVIGLIYRVPMMDALDDEGSGYYDTAYSIYNIALIVSSYGMPLAVSKMVAAKVTLKEYKNERRVLIGSLLFAITTGLITAAVVFFGADFFAGVILNSPKSALPLKVLSPTIFLCAVMGTLRGYFQGNSNMIPTSVSQIIEQIVNAIVSVLATFAFIKMYNSHPDQYAYGASGGTLGTTSGALAGLFVLGIIFAMNNKARKARLKEDISDKVESYKDIYKLILATIIPVIFSQTIYNLNSVVDRAVFNHLNDASEKVNSAYIGIYAKYVLMVNIPVAIATALGNSIVPVIVAEKVKGNIEGMKSKINMAIKFNMLIAIPSTVGLGVLSVNIMRMLFASADSNELAGRMLSVGALAVAFYALSTISNAILQAMHLMRKPLVHSAIAFVIHLVFIVIFMNMGLGIYSLAVGNVLFAFIVCVLNWRSIAKELNYRQEIKTTFVIPTISALIMGVVAVIVCNCLIKAMGSNTISTIIAILCALISYAIFLVKLGGLTKDEVMRFPKGNKIYRLFVKLHLMK